MSDWTTKNIPSQKGKIAIVTGTGGLGYETALQLAIAGATVIIAGRNSKKGSDAVAAILAMHPTAAVSFEILDLADLTSIKDFAARLRQTLNCVDLLINNAAVMRPPSRLETVDEFELQFGTNYLGHFALTAVLAPLLMASKSPRVVTLSSIAARNAVINFQDLQSEKQYNSMGAYGQSKLACLMFAFELQRRSTEAGWGITSIAAHPGISRTEIIYNGSGKWSPFGVIRTLFWFLFQPVPQGALPTLFAATSPQAKAGAYYGPGGVAEVRGFPTLAKIPHQALDSFDNTKLFSESEKLTGIAFPVAENSNSNSIAVGN